MADKRSPGPTLAALRRDVAALRKIGMRLWEHRQTQPCALSRFVGCTYTTDEMIQIVAETERREDAARIAREMGRVVQEYDDYVRGLERLRAESTRLGMSPQAKRKGKSGEGRDNA